MINFDDVSRLIDYYHIQTFVRDDGSTGIRAPGDTPKDAWEEIRARKQEIVQFCAERDALTAARKAAVDAMPGLDEIRHALYERAEYRKAFNAMMDDEYNDGVFPPKRPEIDVAALLAKYPRAAAYIDANGWKMSSHYVKSAIGRKAMDRLADGDAPEDVIKEMKSEWDAYVTAHLYD